MWISLIAIAASFAGGFFIANALNRSELNLLRAENERLKTASTPAPDAQDQPTISDAELREKIAKADSDPGDFVYQKKLGLALYQYAAMKQDTNLFKESARILDRASKIRKDDLDIMVGLGNAHFDLGFYGKNNDELVIAREYYSRALATRPNDVEIRTDLGLTYFLYDPPDDARAVEEFQRSLRSNPKHEKTLEFMIQSMLRSKRIEDSEKYLAQLQAANPANENLPGLKSKIAEARGAQPK